MKLSKAFDGEGNNRENILTSLGFGDMVGAVQLGLCPFCMKAITDDEFKDEISRKEFDISGLCQICQDKMFGE